MTRDEYNAIALDEVEINFHRNPDVGEVYVIVTSKDWEDTDGFRFKVSEEFLSTLADRGCQTRRLGKKELVLSDDEAKALAVPPLDLSDWTVVDHAKARTWSVGPSDAEPPPKIAAYLAEIEAVTAKIAAEKGSTP